MYRIVGADQKEYGPVSAEQVREWIAQGRANAQTIVKFEEGAWKPLGTYPEFANLFPSASTFPPGVPPPIGQPYATPPLSSAPAYGAPRPYVPTYLVWSILATLCCCPPPLGIVAIIYSAQVNSKLDRGDIEGAQRASTLARNWCIATAVVALILNFWLTGHYFSWITANMPNLPH
ncbi:MAG: Interferon-induced transrane protein [Verrucomicrobiales bacterium]|jgi:hypothetical protein|nr:Interferon-induced transrane protein [Verrucomicrobiales bacterium]